MEGTLKERLTVFVTRLETMSAKLDLSPNAPHKERDEKVSAMLIAAAEYAAIACDMSDTSSVLSQLIIAEDLEGLLPESFGAPESDIIIGVGIPARGNETALAQVARFFESLEADAEKKGEEGDKHEGGGHVHSHLIRACASPDVDALFSPKQPPEQKPDGDKQEPKPDAKPQDHQPHDAAKVPPTECIVGEVLVPESKDPVKGALDVADVLLKRAETILDQAEKELA